MLSTVPGKLPLPSPAPSVSYHPWPCRNQCLSPSPFPTNSLFWKGLAEPHLNPGSYSSSLQWFPQRISLGGGGRRSDSREPQCQTPPGQCCPQPPGGRWTCSPVHSPHLSKPGILKQGSPRVLPHNPSWSLPTQGCLLLALRTSSPSTYSEQGKFMGPGGQVPFFHGVFPRQPLGEGRERAP